VTWTVILPLGEADESRPAIGAELLPPGFIFHIMSGKDFQSRHLDQTEAMG